MYVLSVFVYEIQWIFSTLHLKPARGYCLSLSLSLSVVPGVSRICRKPCSVLLSYDRSISACSIDVACTMDFKRRHKWNSNGFKSGERAGRATGPPRPIHLSAKCWFKNCPATRLKRGRAPSCINRVRSLISTGTSSDISCKRALKKSTCFVPVSFPSREKGPIKNLSIIPAHAFQTKLVSMPWMHNNMWIFFIPIMIINHCENWMYHPW